MFGSVLFLILFYGICTYGICCDGGSKDIKQFAKGFSKFRIFILIALFALGITLVAVLIGQNHYIYYWDYSGYWSLSISRMNYMFEHDFFDIIKTLWSSINQDEYNNFLPTIMAFPLSIFGCTFGKYVVINYIMFCLPVFLIQGLIVKKMIQNSNISRQALFLISVCLSAFFAGNYYALLRGYIDVAFLLPASVALYLFIDYDFMIIRLSKNIAIVLALILTWICRRYTVFFLIGYVISLIFKAVVTAVHEKNRKARKKIFTNLCHMGLAGCGILLIFFREFVFHALLTDYNAMYSAYNTTLKTKISYLVEAFGFFTGILVIGIGILCIKEKKNMINYVSLLLMSVCETVVFWRTQDMGVQHRMILNLPVFLICMMIFECWEGGSNKEKKSIKFSWRNVCVMICAFSFIVNFVMSFSSHIPSVWNGTLFSSRYYPLQRSDIEDLDSLVEELNEFTKGTEDLVYVASSGEVLNDDILRRIHMPDSENAVPNMLQSCHVDLRDGFPVGFLYAKYIVTSDPVQTHLATGQEVVTYLAEGVNESGSYIGCHFVLVDEIELDHHVCAKVFRKISDFSESDLEQMRNHFSEVYPGYEEIFADRIQYS